MAMTHEKITLAQLESFLFKAALAKCRKRITAVMQDLLTGQERVTPLLDQLQEADG